MDTIKRLRLLNNQRRLDQKTIFSGLKILEYQAMDIQTQLKVEADRFDSQKQPAHVERSILNVLQQFRTIYNVEVTLENNFESSHLLVVDSGKLE